MSAPAGFINPKDSPYNAAGTGSGDDSGAINSAAADCASQGKDLWMPPSSGDFRVTDTVEIPAGVNVEGWQEIEYAGPTDRPCIVIGSSGVQNRAVSVRIRVEGSGNDWADSDFVGIRILNSLGGRFMIVRTGRNLKAFANLQFVAEAGMECAANTVKLVECMSSRYRCHFDSRGTTGKCRDNLVFGGRITHVGSVSGELGANSFFGSSDGTAATNTRNNVWIGGVLEGAWENFGEHYDMHCQGPFNEHRWHRLEAKMEEPNLGGAMLIDGAAAEYNLGWPKHWQATPSTPRINLINGAPTNVNAYSRNRQRSDGDTDDYVVYGAQR